MANIRRSLTRTFFRLVLPLAAVAAGLYWYANGGRYITTENAYVKANIVAISATIDGRVVAVRASDNQTIAAGEVLFELDPEPYRIALAKAEARLKSVRNDIESARAEHGQIQVEIENARQRVEFYARRFKRQSELQVKGIASEEKREEAEQELLQTQQQVRVLQQKLRAAVAVLGGDASVPVDRHPNYLEAKAARARAALELGYAVVSSPVAGVVTRMRLQPGEWVEAGKPVFNLIENGSLWVEANLKETQLTHVEIGQRVALTIDAYPEQHFAGSVASISPATGAEFLVLPAQNATGNWVKVVQRLPVRIAIERASGQPALRAGMTVRVSIDTEHERRLRAMLRNAVAQIRGE